MSWIALFGRFVLSDILASVLIFPTWWYGDGFVAVLRWSGQSLNYRWRSYAIGLWLKNLSVPMYGQYDLMGRAVSVVMRIVVIGARLVAFGIEAVGHAVLALVWLAWLPLTVVFLLPSLSQGAFGSWFVSA